MAYRNLIAFAVTAGVPFADACKMPEVDLIGWSILLLRASGHPVKLDDSGEIHDPVRVDDEKKAYRCMASIAADAVADVRQWLEWEPKPWVVEAQLKYACNTSALESITAHLKAMTLSAEQAEELTKLVRQRIRPAV